ncbi:MAG: rod shape-determining protein MreD [Coxiellaceae bacterium]|nr:rod shape-determining protein MreD [Coxiellaceae bacterium]|tara:strand:- start:1673 stop:2173 length:501 start_codon:yes stop_codon:yes gene_type:complete
MITSDYDIHRQKWRIRCIWCLSLLVAMMWNVIPRSHVWHAVLPDGVFIVLIYWFLIDNTPRGLVSVFFIGLLTDLSLGSLLGLHAMIYSIMMFAVLRWRKVLSALPIWQQGLVVALLVVLFNGLQWTVFAQVGLSMSAWSWLSPWIAGYCIWPLLVVGMQAVMLRR